MANRTPPFEFPPRQVALYSLNVGVEFLPPLHTTKSVGKGDLLDGGAIQK